MLSQPGTRKRRAVLALVTSLPMERRKVLVRSVVRSDDSCARRWRWWWQ